MLTFQYVFQGILIPLRSATGRRASISCLSMIFTFYSTNTRSFEVSCSHQALLGRASLLCLFLCGHVIFPTFSAWLTSIYPSVSPPPGSLLGMESAPLCSPVAFNDSFNQLLFMWYVPGPVLLVMHQCIEQIQILPQGTYILDGNDSEPLYNPI